MSVSKLPTITDVQLFGAIESLFYRPDLCTQEKVEELTNTIAQAFFQRTEREPEERNLFNTWMWGKISNKEPIIPSDIVNTLFMKSMQIQKPINPEMHVTVETVVVPRMRKFDMRLVPHYPLEDKQEGAINQWYAKFVETYMTDNDILNVVKEYEKDVKRNTDWDKLIKKHPKFQAKLDKIDAKNNEIKIELENAIFSGEITKEILDLLIFRIRDISLDKPLIEYSEDPKIVKILVPKYFDLFKTYHKNYKNIKMLNIFKDGLIDGLNLLFKKKQPVEKKE